MEEAFQENVDGCKGKVHMEAGYPAEPCTGLRGREETRRQCRSGQVRGVGSEGLLRAAGPVWFNST